MKKILALILCLIIAVSVTGCLSKEGSEPKASDVVATVNGEEIKKEEFDFYLYNIKLQMEQEEGIENSEEFWSKTEIDGTLAIEVAKQKALDEVATAAIIRQKIDEYNMKLESAQVEEINEYIGYVRAQLGGEDAYKTWLEENKLTEESYEKLIRTDYYAQLLSEKFGGDADEAGVKEYYTTGVARVKHILIQFNENEAQEDTKARAEAILERALDGEDFDKMVAELSEDPGSTSEPDGYYLGEGYIVGSEGSMVPEFESASLALEVGEISDIVETSYGYHIIKRYENAESVLTENYDQIKSYADGIAFEKVFDEWKQSAKIEKNEKVYNAIK